MADEQEQNNSQEVVLATGDDEIIPIEALEDAEDKKDSAEEVKEEGLLSSKNKKLLVFGGAGAGVLIIILVAVLIIVLSSGKEEQTNAFDSSPIPVEQSRPAIQQFNRSKIDDMLKKANSLYESGNKIEALRIYENVSRFSESLSSYNLGVSQMNQGRYAEAIASFKKAIEIRENADVSALNAAVCALHLNNEPLFKYYIDLARTFLDTSSPHYAYYDALLNYYKGFYVESLYILQGVDYPFYKDEIKYLKSKIFSLLYQDEEAIKAINKIENYNSNLPLGLLYARTGKYGEAKRYLSAVHPEDKNYYYARLASAIVNMKTGNFGTAANELSEVYDKNATFATTTFPIKVVLKPEYFSIEATQAAYDKKIFFNRDNVFEMLIYFTPYQTYDSEQTMQYIRKGGINAFIAENSEAEKYLQTGKTVSKVNADLARAISLALEGRLRAANAEFERLTKVYSRHSILHFDHALTYAKLGDFASAYKQFVTSYHLNPRNHLAGVYAAVTAELIGRDHRRLDREISENLANDTTTQYREFYEAVMFLLQGNTAAINRWLEESDCKKAVCTAFDLITSNLNDRLEIAKQKSREMLEIMPGDALTHTLFFLSNYENEDIKEFAKNIQIYFFNSQIDKGALYGGSIIARRQFVRLLAVSGMLNLEREQIKRDLENAGDNVNSILEALAYIDLFTRNYEEAYQIYNKLVYENKFTDDGTLFHASVAAIGSSHPESAIAYIEFARLTNPTAQNYRMALGWLYQETGNIQAAITQYEAIGNVDYKSKFFTFKIER